jgi:hypothetical protein
VTAPEPETLTASDPLTCPVCPHRKADHDRIADRYCSATAAGNGSAKGCVCKPVR